MSMVRRDKVGFGEEYHTDSKKLEYTADCDSRSSNRSCRDVRRYTLCTRYTAVTQSGRVITMSFWALNNKTICTRSLKTSAVMSNLLL
jgi:hypothetical protein